jgi:replicative superfamily II helicase
MGWGMLAVVLDHMRDRLQAGARDDLLEMAQVTFVKSRTARLLWENGFRSVQALAEADPKDIVPVLMMVGIYPRIINVCVLVLIFCPSLARGKCRSQKK